MKAQRVIQHWRQALAHIVRAWRRLFLFQVWYTLVVGAVLSAVVGWLLQALIASAGTAAVTNYDLVSFLFSLPGLCFLAVVIGAGCASYFMERCGFILLMAPGEEMRPFDALRYSLRNAWPLIQLGWWYALILGVLAIPFAATGLVAAQILIGAQDINYYLYHQPREWWLAIACGAVLAVGFAAAAIALVVRFGFAMQVVLFEHQAPRAALARSWTLARGRTIFFACILGGWWLVTSLVAGVFSATLLLIAAYCLDAARTNSLLALTVAICFSILLALANASGHVLALSGEAILANRLYRDVGGIAAAPGGIAAAPARELRALVSRPRLGVWVTASLTVLVCLGAVAAWRLTTVNLRDGFSITAHRAGAARAPENTLAALQLAIEDGADLAEIDVQTTRDGQLVILHDGDLARIGGDPRRVQDLTFDEIRQIDIGRWRGESFAGQHVATLAEMIELARGKIQLNVELKYNRDDPALAGRVIDLLRAERVLDDCVITSLSYSAVSEAKRLAPEASVGLIVTKSIGDPTEVEADFLSLNQNAVSARLIHRAHARGKQVHVWTVNDRATMQRMIEMGVDSLITDYPGEAADLRRDRAALSTAELFVARLRSALLGR